MALPQVPEQTDSQQTKLAEYELDSAFDPEVDTPVVPTSQPEAKAEKPKSLPERNEAGQFVKSKHPAFLTRTARDLGFEADEIEQAAPEELRAWIAIEQQNRMLGRRIESQPPTHSTPAPEAAGPPPSPKAAASDGFQHGLDSERYDADLLAAFDKLAAHFEAKLKPFAEKVGGLEKAHIAREAEALTQTMDRMFGEFPEFFGSKSGRDTPKDSIEWRRRQAVLRDMDSMGPGNAEQQFREAARMLNLSKAPAKPQSDPDEERRRWQDAAVARPTQRQPSPEPKGDRAAMKAVASKLRTNGYFPDDYGSPEEASLPD